MEPDWQSDDGRHQLYCADCLDVLPHLEGVEAVVTDPPYGIGYFPGGGGGYHLSDGTRAGKTFSDDDVVCGDNRPFDPSPLLPMKVATILWGGNHYASRLPDSSAWLVWDKRENVKSNDFADCEAAWTNLNQPARLFSHLWMGMIRASERGAERVHPTQKPIALMEWCLSFVPDAETILDPFMGSGTTGIACIRTGRRFIGVERERKYFDIAVRRMESELAQGRLFELERTTP